MITLKPFQLENVNIHYQWNNDEELNFFDSDFPHQNEPFSSFLERIKKVVNKNNPNTRLFEIHDGVNDRLIGVVDIRHIDSINRKCDIEVVIGNRSYRNQGYGKQALLSGLDFCFNTLSMHKVTTTAFSFNENWISLVEKLGFQNEGTLRSHIIKRGKYCDKMIFGMLDDEYKELQKQLELTEKAVMK